MTTQSKQETLRKAARVAADTARRQAISVLARERGGINPRTRDGIFAEAKLAARHAAEQVYLAAGYKRCKAETCTQLTSPGYALCPTCVEQRAHPVHPGQAIAARQFVTGR